MRRKDREVVGKKEQLAILEKCTVCRLAMMDEGMPYVVPLNFGYDWQEDGLVIYCHSAKEGRKISVLQKNNQVCVEMDGAHQLIEGDVPCTYGYAFESLIGFGKAEILEDAAEKERGLQQIMKRQAGLEGLSFSPQMLQNVAVIKIAISQMTGKRNEMPK